MSLQQSCETRSNGKRPLANNLIQESSRLAQKRALKITSQSTLPFAPAPLSPLATQLPPSDSTPCLENDQDEWEELLTKKTIRAHARTTFEPNWSLVVDAGSYRERSPAKRSTGSSRISFIYKHSLALERRQPNGHFSKKY
jgi:hypothetical protein